MRVCIREVSRGFGKQSRLPSPPLLPSPSSSPSLFANFKVFELFFCCCCWSRGREREEGEREEEERRERRVAQVEVKTKTSKFNQVRFARLLGPGI
jgi:hypothetical protein